MNISAWAHRNRPLTILSTTLLMAFGAVSYVTMPALEDPQILIRDAVISTRHPGMSAERVERLISKRIEEAIRRVPELEEVRSVSMPGASVIHAVVADKYFDLAQIWDELRKKVEDVQHELPEGTLPSRIDDDFGDVAVMTVALRSDGFTMSEMTDTAKHVHDALYALEGTKKVDLLGGQDERIFVETDAARLEQLGLSPSMIGESLAAQNTLRSGGELTSGDRRFVVQPTGVFTGLADVENTLVRLPKGTESVRLGDLATVTRAYSDPPELTAYYQGDPAVVFAVSMLPGFRALEYCDRLLEKLRVLEKSLPVGYQLDIITNQADAVSQAVFGVSLNVAETLLIVLAVVMLFLGLKTGLIVGAIIPAVMLITVAIMGATNMPLQRMSLATLVIALGLLVDSAIVIAEDFKRRLQDGESRDEALSNCGRTLAVPLLSSTATTVLVFLPLMLAPDLSGEFTRSISLVILISLTVSWVLSMVVTPTLCHRFIPDPVATGEEDTLSDRLFRPLEGLYRSSLTWTLNHRLVFGAAIGLMFASAMFLMSQNPVKFFPDSDRSQVLVYVDLPSDASPRATDRVVREMTEHVADETSYPAVVDVVGYAGFGGPRFVLSLTPFDPAPNRGFLTVNIARLEDVEPTVEKLRDEFNRRFPEANTRIRRMFYGPSDSNIIQVQAKGPDSDVLYATATKLAALLGDVPGMVDVYSDWETKTVRFDVTVDQEMARRAGVSSRNVARSLDMHFSGAVVSEYREEDDLFPIVMRARAKDRQGVDALKSLTVERDHSGTVPLVQVARFEMVPEFSRIARENLSKTVTVEARNLRQTAEDLAPMLVDRLDALGDTLPPGHWIELDGVVVESKESQAALGANFPLCFAIMFLLLVAQFNSFKRPLIVFLTMPLVVIGAAYGLFFMQADFGFMVILGLLSLMGIIVNNAIVLIDRIDTELAEGKPLKRAIIDASVRRLRPIVMTTVTTILGFLPLIVFRDALFYPMASAMAFGLLVGTILTLGVVPLLYQALVRTGGVSAEERSAAGALVSG